MKIFYNIDFFNIIKIKRLFQANNLFRLSYSDYLIQNKVNSFV